MQSSTRIIVMTGATSGLGVHALRVLVAEPGTRAIIGARGAAPDAVEAVPLDLASLASVRAFADAVGHRLGTVPIDVLVLNAGAQFRSATRSADGFEATFAVNHLAHYLLVRLLLPRMADGGRIVFTTSDTHDPAALPWIMRGMAPRALDPEQLAHPPNSSGPSMRAYPASKLCNLLTARAVAAHAEVQARHIRVIAYNPGMTLGTKLGRTEANRQHSERAAAGWVRGLLKLVSKVNAAFHPGTSERSGEALAHLALGSVAPPEGRIYASLVRGEITFPDPSVLARSDEARDRLWRESARMVGLPP